MDEDESPYFFTTSNEMIGIFDLTPDKYDDSVNFNFTPKDIFEEEIQHDIDLVETTKGFEDEMNYFTTFTESFQNPNTTAWQIMNMTNEQVEDIMITDDNIDVINDTDSIDFKLPVQKKKPQEEELQPTVNPQAPVIVEIKKQSYQKHFCGNSPKYTGTIPSSNIRICGKLHNGKDWCSNQATFVCLTCDMVGTYYVVTTCHPHFSIHKIWLKNDKSGKYFELEADIIPSPATVYFLYMGQNEVEKVHFSKSSEVIKETGATLKTKPFKGMISVEKEIEFKVRLQKKKNEPGSVHPKSKMLENE